VKREFGTRWGGRCPFHRLVGSGRIAGGMDTNVHVTAALLAALLLAGCGTSDEESSSGSRPDDRGSIVFSNFAEGSGGYYAIRPDGTGLRKLRIDGDDLAFSADGRFVAVAVTSFERDKVWGDDLILISRVDGSERRRVPLAEGGISGVSLSPDGSRVALVYVSGLHGRRLSTPRASLRTAWARPAAPGHLPLGRRRAPSYRSRDRNPWFAERRVAHRVGFANSGCLVFVDESAD
jgi:hypothetical protein